MSAVLGPISPIDVVAEIVVGLHQTDVRLHITGAYTTLMTFPGLLGTNDSGDL
jgi:hypothetical protein